jgi:hypothetical protein
VEVELFTNDASLSLFPAGNAYTILSVTPFAITSSVVKMSMAGCVSSTEVWEIGDERVRARGGTLDVWMTQNFAPIFPRKGTHKAKNPAMTSMVHSSPILSFENVTANLQ